MTQVRLARNAGWLDRVVRTLRGGAGETLETLRDRLVPFAWSEDCPRAETLADAGDAARFRRHPLAGLDRGGLSALLIYWPPGHSTLPHDHAGLGGIELVVDGTLQVDEFVRVGERARPALALARSLYLGVGDAAVFSGERYVHRCRNLSTSRGTLTLHVYGGALDAYRSFVADARGRWREQPETARSDGALG